MNEVDLHLLVERVKDYAIFMLDTSGNVVSWNEGAHRIKGYSTAEITGKHLSTFYTPEDVRAGVPQRLLAEAVEKGHVENEGWRVRKDGTRFWADVLITALRDDDGNLRGFGKVTRDLTERKVVEDAMSELSGHLVGLQDDERRRIGRDLHDTTSPLLTRLSSKLHQAQQRVRDGRGDLGPLIEESLTMADAIGTMVRTLASMLHPQVLDQGGLLPALKWYLDVCSGRNGMKITAQLPESMPRLPRECEVVLFRIAQEWLRAAIGAGSTAVRLQLASGSASVELALDCADGGWMIQARGHRAPRKELDIVLAGLRERVRQLGGQLEVAPRPSGAQLKVRLPSPAP